MRKYNNAEKNITLNKAFPTFKVIDKIRIPIFKDD